MKLAFQRGFQTRDVELAFGEFVEHLDETAAE